MLMDEPTSLSPLLSNFCDFEDSWTLLLHWKERGVSNDIPKVKNADLSKGKTLKHLFAKRNRVCVDGDCSVSAYIWA